MTVSSSSLNCSWPSLRSAWNKRTVMDERSKVTVFHFMPFLYDLDLELWDSQCKILFLQTLPGINGKYLQSEDDIVKTFYNVKDKTGKQFHGKHICKRLFMVYLFAGKASPGAISFCPFKSNVWYLYCELSRELSNAWRLMLNKWVFHCHGPR